MKSALNFVLSLGVRENQSFEDRALIKMVNFGSFFGMIASLSFFFASLRVDSLILSASLLGFPVIFTFVMYFQWKGYYILARNLLYFSMCAEITTFAFIENPSSFTLNYFFGIGMLSFIVYRSRVGQFFGFGFAMLCYFLVNTIQDKVQVRLEFDPVIYLLDSFTLFAAIFLCMLYFMRIYQGANAAVQAQKLELEKINVNKDKLISILSHDVKAPINALQGLLHAYDQKVLTPEEINDLLVKIKHEFGRQFQFIDNLLQWSQNQLNEINVVQVKLKPTELIETCVKQLEHAIIEKNINVHYDFLSEDEAVVDRIHLSIVIRNILNNAIKFSPVGGTITNRCYKKDHNFIIHIEDAGEGFDEEIINSFMRGEIVLKTKEGTQNEKGNGLGLVLSKELITKNGGAILINNLPKQGARVELILPTIESLAGI